MENKRPREVSLSDFGQLTLRANVVYAERCARRVRPGFELPADAPRRREQMAAVDAAIRVATAFCRGVPTEPGQAAAAVRLAEVAAEENCESTGYTGYAAVRAAQAVVYAEEFLRNPGENDVIEVVAAAFGAGRVLAANVDIFMLDLVVAALLADVDKLLSLGHGAIQDLGPPIDPSENGPLGPLWPAGTPTCYAPRVSGSSD
jgi:hypothetical protein